MASSQETVSTGCFARSRRKKLSKMREYSHWVQAGTPDLQGCGHRILSGGMGMLEPQSAGAVQGCDVRDLWTPPLLGSHCVKTRPGHRFGARGGAVGCEEKGDSSLTLSCIFTMHPEFLAKAMLRTFSPKSVNG
ncbi:uncharacterized protein LOC105261223 isoform X4 [Felis catus]|uniref:uncharacterized protein LOC105261223 isoform X4 n=1 Tax=Felis catus TaxID=9685 RepID=UPI001D19D8F4|nr:uncharacterized protein LOC105261223 isoform X4 [Felis catus]